MTLAPTEVKSGNLKYLFFVVLVFIYFSDVKSYIRVVHVVQITSCNVYQTQRASSGGPTILNFHTSLSYTEKNAMRTPRARPKAWGLVRLLAVVGLFWARSLRSS